MQQIKYDMIFGIGGTLIAIALIFQWAVYTKQWRPDTTHSLDFCYRL